MTDSKLRHRPTQSENVELQAKQSNGNDNGNDHREPKAIDPPVSETVSATRGYVFMLLLALQFGLQPLLQKSCVDTKLVTKTSLVMVTESIKITMCLTLIYTSGSATAIYRTWKLKESLRVACLPAACYALQNYLSQLAFTHLDSVTFVVLNQTKTLSAAVCLYFIMGRRQSFQQLIALAMLLAAALLLNAKVSGESGESHKDKSVSWQLGVLPVLTASFLSGFSAVVTQKTLQNGNRNSYLLSCELAVIGIGFMLVSTLMTHDGQKILSHGFWSGWTWRTFLPVLSQSAGGIVVGQVTKHAGSVKKGFALIGGILVTALAQFAFEGKRLEPVHYVSAFLVACSTWLHSRYPHASQLKKAS